MTHTRNFLFPFALTLGCSLLSACGGAPPEAYEALADSLQDDDARGCEGIDAQRHVFRVKIANGRRLNVVGYLYSRGGVGDKTLLVAVHGATYTHSYWDAPRINQHSYSFACYMARRNYTVLAIDNLGAGESTGEGMIEGDAIRLTDEWDALGQLLTQLRAPHHNPIGCGFDKTVLVGHSFGSLASIGTQAAGHPADALIVTGWSHMPPPGGLPVDNSVIFQLAATPYVRIDGALRTRLYFGPTADPAMIAYDANHLADHLPRGVFLDSFGAAFNPVLSHATQVTGKVLVQLGEHDALFSSDGNAERAAYPLAQVTAQTLPTVGHCFNLQPENRHGWSLMDTWLRQNHLR